MTSDSSQKSDSYRVILIWDDVPPHLGQKAAIDVEKNFTKRHWHRNVTCTWRSDNRSIILEAENDFGDYGLALIDEFSDEITTCVRNAGSGGIKIVSVNKI